MRVTIPLTNGQRFSAEPDADRWVEIPKGTKPAEPAWSECEADFRSDRSGYANCFNDLCECWSTWNNLNHQFRIRPTLNRSWSDIGLADEQMPQAQRDYANPVTVEGPISVKLWHEGSTAKMQVLAMPERLRGAHHSNNPIATLDDKNLGSIHEPALEGRYVWLRGTHRKSDGFIAGISCLSDFDANAYLSRVESLIRHANTLPLVKGEEPTEAAAQPDPRIAALEAENAALRWAIGKAGIELATHAEGFVLHSDSTEHYISDHEVPHFLAARAAMERKP